MKVTIEVNGEDAPMELKRLAHMVDAYSALFDISNNLYNRVKYKEGDLATNLLAEVSRILEENNITEDLLS